MLIVLIHLVEVICSWALIIILWCLTQLAAWVLHETCLNSFVLWDLKVAVRKVVHIVFFDCTFVALFVVDQLVNKVHGILTCRKLRVVTFAKAVLSGRFCSLLRLAALSSHDQVLSFSSKTKLALGSRLICRVLIVRIILATFECRVSLFERHEVTMAYHAFLSWSVSHIIIFVLIWWRHWLVLAQAHSAEVNDSLLLIVANWPLFNWSIKLFVTILLLDVLICGVDLGLSFVEEHLFVIIHLLLPITLARVLTVHLAFICTCVTQAGVKSGLL